MKKGHRNQEDIKIGIVVKPHSIVDERTVVIKHQYARPRHATMFAAEWTCDMTHMTKGLRGYGLQQDVSVQVER